MGLALFIASGLAASAQADAASDFAELRRGALPSRATMLGFAPDGTAYVRTLTCGETGTTYCLVVLHAVAPNGSVRQTPLLEVHDFYCGDGYDESRCDVLSRAERARFIRRERDALAALPPLAPAQAAADPLHVCGSLADGPTSLRVRGGRRDASDGDIDLQLVSASGRVVRIATLARGDTGGGTISAAYVSPRGDSVIVIASVASGSGEWSEGSQHVLRIDLSTARAALTTP